MTRMRGDRRVSVIIEAACEQSGYLPSNMLGRSMRDGLPGWRRRTMAACVEAGVDPAIVADVFGRKPDAIRRAHRCEEGDAFMLELAAIGRRSHLRVIDGGAA